MTRSLLKATARLYPRWWRQRYGDGLDALIEDADPQWTDLFGIVGEVLAMQWRSGWKYALVIVAAVVVGAAVAAGLALEQPVEYVADAVVQPHVTDVAAAPSELLNQAWQETTSRTNLSRLIRGLDLYPLERERLPLEDVIERMRNEDLKLDSYDRQSARILFHYADRGKARAVVDEISREWSRPKANWPGNLELIRPAALPGAREPTDWVPFLAYGTGGGLLVGLIAAGIWWRPQKAALLVGCGLFWAVVVAVVLFLAIPEAYVSRAVLVARIAPERVYAGMTGKQQNAEISRWGDFVHTTILRREILSEIAQRHSIDLYSANEKHVRMEQTLERMERDLHVEITPGKERGRCLLVVKFRYPEAAKAQAVVKALTTKICDLGYPPEKDQRIETSTATSFSVRPLHDVVVEVRDAASLPETPESPVPWVIWSWSAAGGVLLGILTMLLARHLPARIRTDSAIELLPTSSPESTSLSR
jgi:hypothetical protein